MDYILQSLMQPVWQYFFEPDYTGKFAIYNNPKTENPWLIHIEGKVLKRHKGDIFEHNYFKGKAILLTRCDGDSLKPLPSIKHTWEDIPKEHIQIIDVNKDITSMFNR